MAYQALYRKFRPPVWEDVKGQDHIVTTLRNQIISDRVGHAYLFCGTRGTGKTSVAKIFARAVNCEQPDNGNPCGNCESCRTALEGTNLNIIEIDAASNNGVDNVREIIDEIAYSPVKGKKKVYIVDEAHMLSTGAFNAFLKTLEDPPEYVMFILATTEAQKILPTILSRCQRYDFHRITAKVIEKRLREVADAEKIDTEKAALEYIARAADGALRDGLSLLDQCAAFYAGEKLTHDRVLEVLGAVDTEVFHAFFEALQKGDVIAAVDVLDEVVYQGKELAQFTGDFIWYLRNLMLAQTAEGAERIIDLSAEQMKELREQAASTDIGVIMRLIRVFSETQAQMRYDVQKRTLLEMTVVRVCRPSSDSGEASIEARVAALEEQENRVFAALRLIESGAFTPGANTGQQEKKRTEETTVSAVSEEDKKKWEVALPEEIREVAAHWQEYIPSMSGRLKAYMQALPQPKLSVTEDGRKLLIVLFHKQHADAFGSYPALLEELEGILRSHTEKEVPVAVEYMSDPGTFGRTYPDLSEIIHMRIEEDEDE